MIVSDRVKAVYEKYNITGDSRAIEELNYTLRHEKDTPRRFIEKDYECELSFQDVTEQEQKDKIKRVEDDIKMIENRINK